MSTPEPHLRSARGLGGAGLGLLVAAVLSIAAFHLVGAVYLNGFRLDLGSLNFPTPRYISLVAFWMPFGALSAGFLALGLSRSFASATLFGPRLRALVDEWLALPDGR